MCFGLQPVCDPVDQRFPCALTTRPLDKVRTAPLAFVRSWIVGEETVECCERCTGGAHLAELAHIEE